MKTTNLFTDFLIIGLIGFLCLLLPYLIINPELLDFLIKTEIKNSGLSIAVATITIYILGIIFYQLSDSGLKKLSKTFFLNSISNVKDRVNQEVNIDYHLALQKIVVYSKNSYNYLSYRRTMLRVFRALIFSCFLFVLLHLFYSVSLFIFTDINLQFSPTNTLILIGVLLLGIFVRFIYIKQYKGYFSAIINFVKLINDLDANDVQNQNN